MNALEAFKKACSTDCLVPLSFGCKELGTDECEFIAEVPCDSLSHLTDRAIGGIPVQGITEIAGEAGCGKTQLCLMMSLQVQLDKEHGGKDGAAAYLSCGEGTFPIRRLSQLASSYETRTGIASTQLLSNVHIEQCHNIDDAQSILKHKIPELCRNKNVKLLIIDSLAGLLRLEFDTRSAEEMRTRTALLFRLARQLKLLSDIFGIGIVVVNQVKADFMDELLPVAGLVGPQSYRGSTCSSVGSVGGGDGSAGSVPALGMAWAYCVNTRITLHRDSAHLRACPLPAEDADAWAASASVDIDSNPAPPGSGTSLGSSVGVKRPPPSAYGARKMDDGFYDTTADPWAGAAEGEKENSGPQKGSAGLSRGVHSRTPGLHLPQLHERILYYPFSPQQVGGAGSGEGTGAGPSRSSVRTMRLELSGARAAAQCRYEIGIWGIRGVGQPTNATY